MGKHKWEPVGYIPAGQFLESVFCCVFCHEHRTSFEMGAMGNDQICRWADLSEDEPITLPDDPRLIPHSHDDLL